MQEEMQETEVRETTSNSGDSTIKKQRVSHTEYTPGVVIAQRVIWFIAGLFSVIIALRFIFLLLGANQGVWFTDLVYGLSTPLVSPFLGIFGAPTYGVAVFEASSLLAIVIYSLIAWGLAKLVTLTHPHDEI